MTILPRGGCHSGKEIIHAAFDYGDTRYGEFHLNLKRQEKLMPHIFSPPRAGDLVYTHL